MQIALNDEEKQTLLEILNEVLPPEASGLGAEVYRTENYDYREELKRREAIIKSLVARLSSPS